MSAGGGRERLEAALNRVLNDAERYVRSCPDEHREWFERDRDMLRAALAAPSTEGEPADAWVTMYDGEPQGVTFGSAPYIPDSVRYRNVKVPLCGRAPSTGEGEADASDILNVVRSIYRHGYCRGANDRDSERWEPEKAAHEFAPATDVPLEHGVRRLLRLASTGASGGAGELPPSIQDGIQHWRSEAEDIVADVEAAHPPEEDGSPPPGYDFYSMSRVSVLEEALDLLEAKYRLAPPPEGVASGAGEDAP